MLVLTRKLHERIRITLPDGYFGWITIVEIDRGKIRIGLDMPKHLDISREELLPPAEQYCPHQELEQPHVPPQ